MTCRPRDIIKAPKGLERVRFRDGDTADIITTILEMDRLAVHTIDADAAECLRGDDDTNTLDNIWRFIRKNVNYKADPPGHEVVKTPPALVRIGKGDCKSFTIAAVSLMRALGFKGIRYRFASYADGPFTHVYAVCRVDGRDVVVDAVNNDGPRMEAKYVKKKDYAAYAGKVAGIASTPERITQPLLPLLILGGVLLFLK